MQNKVEYVCIGSKKLNTQNQQQKQKTTSNHSEKARAQNTTHRRNFQTSSIHNTHTKHNNGHKMNATTSDKNVICVFAESPHSISSISLSAETVEMAKWQTLPGSHACNTHTHTLIQATMNLSH